MEHENFGDDDPLPGGTLKRVIQLVAFWKKEQDGATVFMMETWNARGVGLGEAGPRYSRPKSQPFLR